MKMELQIRIHLIKKLLLIYSPAGKYKVLINLYIAKRSYRNENNNRE